MWSLTFGCLQNVAYTIWSTIWLTFGSLLAYLWPTVGLLLAHHWPTCCRILQIANKHYDIFVFCLMYQLTYLQGAWVLQMIIMIIIIRHYIIPPFFENTNITECKNKIKEINSPLSLLQQLFRISLAFFFV